MGKTDNPVRGTITIDIDGKTYTMRLDWHGVAQVRRAFPDGYNLSDPEHLSVIMSVAMAKYHPEMNPDAIMDMSPPLELAIQSVTDMINYSWWGAKNAPESKEGQEEESPENPPETTSEATAA